MKRVLVVPWSSAPTKFAILSSLVLAGGALRRPLVRRRLQKQVRGGRTGVLVAGAPLAEVARPPLARHQRDGGLHALFRRLGRPSERLGELQAFGERGREGLPAGEKRVDH